MSEFCFFCGNYGHSNDFYCKVRAHDYSLTARTGLYFLAFLKPILISWLLILPPFLVFLYFSPNLEPVADVFIFWFCLSSLVGFGFGLLGQMKVERRLRKRFCRECGSGAIYCGSRYIQTEAYLGGGYNETFYKCPVHGMI